MDRYLGRFSVIDGRAERIRDVEELHIHLPDLYARDEARKVHVATFPGHHSAEHENGQLHIYAHVDELGNPAKKFGEPEGTSGIRSSASSGRDTGYVGGIGSIADLNALHLKHHEGVGRIMRRRA
jgi:hypothetical protein